MEKLLNQATLTLLIATAIIINSCKEDLPEVELGKNNLLITEISSTAIGGNYCEIHASFKNYSSNLYSETGFCWSTNPNPTISENSSTESVIGDSIISLTIINLEPSTKYYVSSYVIYNQTVNYSGQIEIYTTDGLPQLTTIAITGITATTATSGGNITASGGSPVTARGVCWATTTSPTLANNKTSDGSGIGSFISSLKDLDLNKTYFLKAYATNSVGTAYGNELTFITPDGKTLTTTAVSNINTTTATSGGNITNDGGSTITARGVCWANTKNPTIANNKTNDGTGTGSFTSSLTSLSGNTTYYVRAYATNSNGIVYGNEVSFSTPIPITVTDADGNVYNAVTIGTQVWMAENLKTTKYNDGSVIQHVPNNDAWPAQTAGAYCWYNNDIANKDTYGALYNWYTLNTAKLAPTGWHVPTHDEWQTLIDYLGGDAVAGGKMKATTTWNSPNTGADNSSGFTALAAGNRYQGFSDMGYYGYWWSSTENFDGSYALGRGLSYNYTKAFIVDTFGKSSGFSVRCIKD